MSTKADWLCHPITKDVQRDLEQDLSTLQTLLISAGITSTDPAVREVAAQISVLKRVIRKIQEQETANEEEST